MPPPPNPPAAGSPTPTPRPVAAGYVSPADYMEECVNNLSESQIPQAIMTYAQAADWAGNILETMRKAEL